MKLILALVTVSLVVVSAELWNQRYGKREAIVRNYGKRAALDIGKKSASRLVEKREAIVRNYGKRAALDIGKKSASRLVKKRAAIVRNYGKRSVSDDANGRRSKRLADGRLAGICEFPYAVQFIQNDEGICTGTILNHRWIVTSARCAENVLRDMNGTYILAGTNDRFIHDGVKFKVDTAIPHEDFNSVDNMELVNDIGLIKTVERIKFSECINKVAVRRRSYIDGVSAVTAGWGQSDFYATSKLHKMNVTLTTKAECEVDYKLGRNQLCGRGDFQGNCLSDRGNPLIYRRKLVAVGSFDSMDCQGPDVYTDVRPYFGWFIRHGLYRIF